MRVPGRFVKKKKRRLQERKKERGRGGVRAHIHTSGLVSIVSRPLTC